MITPIEFQSKTFKNGLGYEKRDVENFLSALLADYETLYKENIELKDKINTLNDGINYYKSIEKTLNKALILAEHTAEDLKESAIKEARVIEEDAKAKAQLILIEAQNNLNDVHQKTLSLIRQYESYKAQFKHLAAAQCELLESDTFQIHVANVDNFTGAKYDNNLNTDNQIKTDNNTNYDNDFDNKSFDELYSEAAASLSDESTTEDVFEFLDVNDED